MEPFAGFTVDECRRRIATGNGALRAVLRPLDAPSRDPEAPADAPLAGVPYVLKDTWDTAGITTTGGSWRHRGRVPPASGPIHRALAGAGAVLLGKSNCSDLAFSAESANHLGGATKNPHDPARTSGGSTGGGAAAVAVGMAAFDWGADFGGSIRTPAGACGVVGLRLSQAAWPGVTEHFPRLAPRFVPMCGMGPLARTVAGCRKVVRAVAPSLRRAVEESAIDPAAAVVWAPDPRTAGEWPLFGDEVDALLARRGARAERSADLPSGARSTELFNGYVCAHLDDLASTGEIPRREALAAVLLALATGGRLDRRIHPNTAVMLLGVQIGALTFHRDRAKRDDEAEAARAAVRRIWASGRLIVAPTATVPPPRHGRAVLAHHWQAFCKLGNLADATACAVPFGRFPGGLPRSLQILGPPGSEEAVLDFAERLEQG